MHSEIKNKGMSLYQKECIFLHSEIKMIECLSEKNVHFYILK